ncbi:MAG: hypothetical protein HQL56_14325 [Magnetococcales bacterium]|nr:hypothetical protein [Magnetococcales bacterium]
MSDVTGHAACPHCQEPMKKWSVAPQTYEDGLGFGTDVLLVCFNDNCPLYVKGWNSMFENYGRVGSVRYFLNARDGDCGALPVGHAMAMRGDIIEE